MTKILRPVCLMVVLALVLSLGVALPSLAATDHGAPLPYSASEQAVYEGVLRIGVSDYGELLSSNGDSAGLEYPRGYEHIAEGTWLEGYLVAYMDGGSDNVAYAMFDDRSSSPAFDPVSYSVVENSARTLVVNVVTETDDGMLRMEQQFNMPKDENAVQITMTLTNVGGENLTDVVLKRCVDLDVDSGGSEGWADYDNVFDVDSSRNMVYAYTSAAYPGTRPPGAESHYVGIAGCPTPDYYDVDDWDDYDQRDSPVNFTTYPQYNDYTATQQWNLRTMTPGESETARVVYSAGYTLAELHGCPLTTRVDFSASPTMGDAPLTVKFQDRSTGGATWHWSFGDGNTSTARNPEHTYQYEGFYTVTLTVDGIAKVKNDLILVESQAVAARLVVRDLNITPAYAQPRQAVGVSANVFNDGGTWGSGTVNLMINGQFEQSVSVGVSPGTAQPVSFIVYKVDPGEYQVDVDGAVGTFYVVEEAPVAPQGGGLLAGGELDQGGIIAIIVIAVILVGGVVVAIILTRPS